MTLDRRKWFDRSQPQTLQIATWLLYLNSFFHIIDVLDLLKSPGVGIGDLLTPGRTGLLFHFASIPLAIAAGFLMANDRKLGYYLGVAAALWPFLTRFYYSEYSLRAVFDPPSVLNLIFEVALVALIVHPQSRDHQRIWFK